MNISVLGGGAGLGGSGSSKSIFVGNLQALQHSPLKSTQEKAERQQKANDRIEYWEQQKENLKNAECEGVEEIAAKLNRLQSYEDAIAAARAAYNNEQMFHILDEAREKGEKIAEAVEEMEPKTPEERSEEILEEIAENLPGAEEAASALEEIAGETEEIQEEMLEQLEEMEEEQADGISGSAAAMVQDGLDQIEEVSAVPEAEAVRESLVRSAQEEEWEKLYRPFDVRI